MRLLFLFFIQVFLFASDFDCIVIGSSPFSLFEALYQRNLGKSVLILEKEPECGGAWKGIDICGLRHVDMGCHQIGSNQNLKAFLEEYAGCKIVQMDHPDLPFNGTYGPNGWYFSKGCYELIGNLLHLIDAAAIAVHTNEKVENVAIDSAAREAIVQTSQGIYRTKKIIAAQMSSFQLSSKPQNCGQSKHYHLYMLIQDPTPFQFTYKHGLISGVSRMMNLTYFSGLIGTGRQLIVLQIHNDRYFDKAETFLDALKAQNLVGKGAYLLDVQTYVYESSLLRLNPQANIDGIIEVLQTGHIQHLSHYISKWSQALKPYNSVL